MQARSPSSPRQAVEDKRKGKQSKEEAEAEDELVAEQLEQRHPEDWAPCSAS